MFTVENISIALFVLLLVYNGYTILQFITFLYYKFRYSNYTATQKDALDNDTLEIMKPLEDFLLSENFIYKSMLVHDSPMVGSDQKYYIAYYFNPTTYVHAYLKTQPFRGALEPTKVTYETIYEDGTITTTINGEKHYTPSVPKGIELFDHNLADINSVYSMHLKDRLNKTEVINQNSFTDTTLVDYKRDEEHKYIESWREKGVLKLTNYGYRFIPTLETLRFSRDGVRGYREFAKRLQSKTVEKIESKSQSNALIGQLDEMDRQRGDSNKMLWLLISLVGFVALFSIIGLSIVDIFIVVVVLLIHELGHLLAMRYFGYSDTSIFFLPFGAAAVGKKESRKAFEEYIIFLAGPLPGILIPLGIIVWNLIYSSSFRPTNEYLNIYILFSLVINYINLLPIYPLDGGRIMQTLLLLRYPKAQFYFYLISLGILIAAMVWMQDIILLIFVVAIALGLKQNYLISQLLSKLLSTHKQEDITKSVVSTLLTTDETYAKESLASKANIAKQALTVIQTSKPSKLLLSFGFAFYLLCLAPPLVIYSYGFLGGDNSEYSKLPDEAKDELSTFYTKVASYQGLTKGGNEPYTIEESIKILEPYIQRKDFNRTIGAPLKNIVENNNSQCNIPNGLRKLYEWHNGITDLLPYEDFYSFEEAKKNYNLLLDDQKTYDSSFTTDYRVIINQYNQEGLAYFCNKEGIYDYSPYNLNEDNKKVYYSVNHMLKIIAEAYRRGIYYIDHSTLETQEAKLSNLQKEYYSAIDKQRYNDVIEYLQDRALKYANSPYGYIKQELLTEIGSSYDVRMVDSVKIYLNDKDKKVRQQAILTLGKLGDRSVMPLLLSHLDDDPMHCHGCALAGLSYLVNGSDANILDRIHQSTTNKKVWIRKKAYQVIARIANPRSLPLLKKLFKDEKPACKIVIVAAFGRIGEIEVLPLLEEYLSQINKMNFEVEYGDKSLDGAPHPKSLKREVEKAISAIKAKNS